MSKSINQEKTYLTIKKTQHRTIMGSRNIAVELFASTESYGSTMMLHKAPQGLNVHNRHREQSY